MKVLIALVAVIALLVSCLYAYGRIRNYSDNISVEYLPQFPTATLSEQVRLGAYNIAHGRGPKLGQSNSAGSIEDKKARLQVIGTFLKDANVDIVVLNEVDFSTRWSGYIDQASVIAEAGGFPYIARQNNYDVILPWYSLQFGNAVLSRFPIQSAVRETLPPLSLLESWFAGNHDAIDTVIELDKGLSLRLIGLHLEVRDEAIRIQAVEQILPQLKNGELVVLAGDLNSQPSTGEEQTAFSALLESGLFTVFPVVSSQDKTFPAEKPNRIIDWILYSSQWEFVSGSVPAVQINTDSHSKKRAESVIAGFWFRKFPQKFELDGKLAVYGELEAIMKLIK